MTPEDLEFYTKNRIFFEKILGSESFIYDDVMESSYIKKPEDKKQHLLASKIFRIRLRSALLAQRIQTK